MPNNMIEELQDISFSSLSCPAFSCKLKMKSYFEKISTAYEYLLTHLFIHSFIHPAKRKAMHLALDTFLRE